MFLNSAGKAGLGCVVAVGMLFSAPDIRLASAAELSVSVKRLTLDTALRIAHGAVKACRKDGIHVAAVVLDRNANVQVVLKDTLAAEITVRVATGKAAASASFRVPTKDLASRANTALGRLDGIIMARGGMPIEAGGVFYGAIGISGAPSGEKDEACAMAGLAPVLEELDFE